jgi:hypothetical protein
VQYSSSGSTAARILTFINTQQHKNVLVGWQLVSKTKITKSWDELPMASHYKPVLLTWKHKGISEFRSRNVQRLREYGRLRYANKRAWISSHLNGNANKAKFAQS